MEEFPYLKSINSDYIEELYTRFKENPDSVDATWRYFFEGMEMAPAAAPTPMAESLSADQVSTLSSEAKVAELINAYRESGNFLAHIDPLSEPPKSHPLLELSRFELKAANLEKTYTAGKLIKIGPAKLSEIITKLKRTYASTIGVEYTHIGDSISRQWLQERMELSENRESLDLESQRFILKRLTESENFERFLHTRYVAQKRFSLEGGEALIPTLDRIIEYAGEVDAKEIIVGMAHRGRLNVLHNIFGKKAELIFTEFEENYESAETEGMGDVKYHMGFSSDITTRHGKPLHLSLAHNPSHLEFVNPVVEGIARSKQRAHKDKDRKKVIPIVIHGDAAFAGEGVVYETLNLSQVSGYRTGGTVHIVINNQIGFTTDPQSARSTTYATDLAMMLEVPIFHVNGDDPEALWYVARLAMEYRQEFKKDVFIDLLCYRKYGHNEGDEPAFTQPLMYQKIRNHASVRELYAKKLAADGRVSTEDAQKLVDDCVMKLAESQNITRTQRPRPFESSYENKWVGLKPSVAGSESQAVQTAVPEATLKLLGERLCKTPEAFHVHPKLVRFLEARLKSVQEAKGIDWGTGEALAFGSLLLENHPVRITGQDCERGTFSHRHSVLHDVENGEIFTPLNHLSETQAEYIVRNSTLSETAVLGFEYGWSLADPYALVIWEAQFGDFANAAQVIIDQFIVASEAKWKRASGITMLLPHGYEGQGPEHSSARLERFLQLCGENNLAVCNLTLPSQLFHALRRQIKRNFRKPLVVMSPKSLLRNPLAVSELKEFSEGSFRTVIDDPNPKVDADKIKRVVLCTGKIYFELWEEREKKSVPSDVAIVRVEQLYPWPTEDLATIFKKYSQVKEVLWVQEEPRNMGAWTHVFNFWAGGLGRFQDKAHNLPIHYVGRAAAAAPATGTHKTHHTTQHKIVHAAFSEL